MVEAKQKNNGKGSLRTVQRALNVLNCFSLVEKELTLTEISDRTFLAKSTTNRMLTTLEKNNFIKIDKYSLKYKLGPRLYYLGHVAGKSIKSREIAYPIMKKLRDETKETVHFYILDGFNCVCVEQSEGLLPVRHLVPIGKAFPLWKGAGGKVLLAYQEESFQEQVFQYIDSENRLGKLEIEKLKDELKLIKGEGCATSQEERGTGSSAVSAPIFEVDGKVDTCISISGLSQRFMPDFIENLKILLKEETLKISENNGYSGGDIT